MRLTRVVFKRSFTLNYVDNVHSCKIKKAEHIVRLLSGWQDSNLRPPAPKAGAITELRYTPKAVANIALFLAYAKLFLK